MSDYPRPVWLTEHQRNDLWSIRSEVGPAIDAIVAAWDAAPADATEAVESAIRKILNERPYCAPEHVVEAVLRALGAPDA